MRRVKLDNVAFTFCLPWQNEMRQQTRGGKGVEDVSELRAK